MSVPPTVRRLLDLLERLAKRDPDVPGGPFRVEAPAAALGGRDAVDPVLAARLDEAVFLGLSGPDVAAGEGLARLERAITDFDLLLDLRAGPELLSRRPPGALGPRTAALVFDLPHPEALAEPAALADLRRWREATAGSVTVTFPVTGADLDATIDDVLPRIAQVPDVAVKVWPRRSDDLEPVRAALPRLEAAARTLALNLAVRPLAAHAAGPPANPLVVWSVVQEGLRAIFRQHPGPCPLPFLMVRAGTDGAWHPCPQPPGPGLPGLDADDPFSGPRARDLRARHLAGDPPEACARCTLRPRLLRSMMDP